MRIVKLTIANFRSYTTATLELDRLNIFRGPHGAGKTSVQMALEYLFTGRCAVTDAAGRGSEDLEGIGTDGLEVKAVLADGTIATRRRQRGVAQLLVSGPDAIPMTGKVAEAWLAQHIAPAAVVSAVLNSFRFLVMPDKERQALLAASLASDPVPLAAEVLEDCRRLQLPYPADGSIRNAEQVKALHKAAFELRTQVNRDIKNLGPIAESVSPYPDYTSADVRETLEEILRDKEVLVAKRAAGVGNYATRKANLDAALEKRKLAEPKCLETAELDRLSKIEKNAPKLAKLQEQIRVAERELRAAEDATRNAKRELEVAEAADRSGRCGACGQEVAGSLKKREERISTARAAHETAVGVSARAQERVLELNRNLEELGDPADATRRISAHREAMEQLQRAESTIREIGTLGPEPKPAEPSSEELELDRRFAQGHEIERALLNYEGSRAEQVKQEERAKKLMAHEATLTRLIEMFGDAGPVKAALVGGRLPAFLERVNGVLWRFGFECRFTMEPFSLQVHALGAKWLQLHQLSESQAFRFSIAFQVALAEATGVGVVVVDRADILLPDVRVQLTDELIESNLEQAFILAAAADAPLPAELPEGVAFFNLAQDSRGVTTVLAAGGKAEVTYAAAE